MFIVLLLLIHYTKGEIFTALVDLNKAYANKIQLENDLLHFAMQEKLNLDKVKVYSENLLFRSTDNIDPETYVSNPLNAYLLLKSVDKLKNELPDLLSSNSDNMLLLETINEAMSHLPTENDVAGSIDALLRLQETYKIPTQHIANGIVHKNYHTNSLTSRDCFEIGLKSFESDYYHFVHWMTEAYNRLTKNSSNDERIKIIDYLSYGYFKQEKFQEALALTNEWLKIDPFHERAIKNKFYFQKLLWNIKNSKTFDKGDYKDLSDEAAINVKPLNHHKETEFRRYEALCRNEDLSQTIKPVNLNCRLFIPHYYFLLSPVKEEVLFDNPRIVMYHDIISENEIEEIKNLAIPKLNRATVQNSVTGKLEYAKYRISKSAWLKSDVSKMTKRIDGRISMLTGINLETAEELQIVNYGIGGHYEPHFDFARKYETNSFEPEIGNRVATLLFYLSDVEAGGATVFTEIGAKVWPKKGSAAFWWNLYPSGDGDLSTRHAACPVLVGSKWVMNKWFHERGQELVRPCALNKYASSTIIRTMLHKWL